MYKPALPETLKFVDGQTNDQLPFYNRMRPLAAQAQADYDAVMALPPAELTKPDMQNKRAAAMETLAGIKFLWAVYEKAIDKEGKKGTFDLPSLHKAGMHAVYNITERLDNLTYKHDEANLPKNQQELSRLEKLFMNSSLTSNEIKMFDNIYQHIESSPTYNPAYTASCEKWTKLADHARRGFNLSSKILGTTLATAGTAGVLLNTMDMTGSATNDDKMALSATAMVLGSALLVFGKLEKECTPDVPFSKESQETVIGAARSIGQIMRKSATLEFVKSQSAAI